MANEKGYEKKSEGKGIIPYDVYSWDGFSNLFNGEFVTKSEGAKKDKLYLGDYVWRGHQSEVWRLVSSFDREFMTNDEFKYKPDRDTILKRHLNSFVYAVRGKLKEFELTVREIKASKVLKKNHIWALAQHYGLRTPLLDWCYSPYVAAYFAFQEKNDDEENNDNRGKKTDKKNENENKCNDKEKSKKEDEQKKCRIVWGLNYKQVCDNYTKTEVFNTGVDYFDPMSSEHPRLINQRGLFTIVENVQVIKKEDIDIEEIVKNNRCSDCNGPWLIKLEIKEKNREEFLRRLSAMNINHISLFPEIKGAAEFSNIGLEFDEYARFHGQWW